MNFVASRLTWIKTYLGQLFLNRIIWKSEKKLIVNILLVYTLPKLVKLDDDYDWVSTST